MKHRMLLAVILSALGVGAQAAAAPFTGTDFSGVYDCTGDDAHEGAYSGVVTMRLIPEQSTGEYGAYEFKLEVPDYGVYPGHAAAHGNHAAMYFALTDPTTRDFGTGIAEFSNNNGKLSFRKYYYEPEFKGGNHGFEDCVKHD